jgi:EAL domain-containing protein (putative c-di-GMP-specific phosphodiesterase class I)
LSAAFFRGGARPGTLGVVFQPIFDVCASVPRVHGFEALVRRKGAASAGLLFETARRTGRESRLDRACVTTAFDAVAALPAGSPVSLNVHASTLGCDEGFPTFLFEAAARKNVAPSLLTVDVVQHMLPCDSDRFAAAVDALRARGVRIAVDDIGLDHSYFRMMLHCAPDFLKVDRALLAGCHRDRRRLALLESLCGLAARLPAQVVAEGIEDPADLEAIRALGVDLAQGFLLAPPSPAADLHPPSVKVNE